MKAFRLTTYPVRCIAKQGVTKRGRKMSSKHGSLLAWIEALAYAVFDRELKNPFLRAAVCNAQANATFVWVQRIIQSTNRVKWEPAHARVQAARLFIRHITHLLGFYRERCSQMAEARQM